MINYPPNVTTNMERLAYSERLIQRWTKLMNILGKWRRFSTNKFYILDQAPQVGTGWKGEDTILGNVTQVFLTLAEANAYTLKAGEILYSGGVTKAIYNTLPAGIRSKQVYKRRLTKAEFESLKARLIRKRGLFIGDTIAAREAVRLDTIYSPDPDA